MEQSKRWGSNGLDVEDHRLGSREERFAQASLIYTALTLFLSVSYFTNDSFYFYFISFPGKRIEELFSRLVDATESRY